MDNNALAALSGKLITVESKRPGNDLVVIEMEVTAVVVIPTSRGPAFYAFGRSKDGTEGVSNMRYWYEDSAVIAPVVNFQAVDMANWFIIPPDNNVFDSHFSYAEKVSQRAQKRLPENAVKLADCVVKATPPAAPAQP